MLLSIFFLAIGFVALVKGADLLIDGSTALAKHFGVSDLIVGLTVVAFGTSLPELIVNLFAGAESGELAIGNVVGSNIANILLILGVASMFKSLTVHRATVYREILFNIGAAAMLAVLVAERFLSEGGFKGLDHIDGIILISYFAMFIYYTFMRISPSQSHEFEESKKHRIPMEHNLKVFGTIAIGAVGLWLGGKLIVDNATEIASTLGVSDALIGVTIVAIGTSLPELAASIIAVRKGNVDIAIGNAVGSNLFNIFWVLGIGALVRPLGFTDKLITDIVINFAVALLLFSTMVFGKYRHQISKREGSLFLFLYVCYMVFAIIRG